MRVQGLDGRVEIVRDAFGVPHCFATSAHDAWFAQGWSHAADRLWQMEYDRRRAQGRWAEAVGHRGVAGDVFYRRVDLTSAVRRDLEALQPQTRSMLAAYADGVNARLADHPLPREFAVAAVEPAPWEPWHSLLVFRVRHILMGSARTKLWRWIVADTLGHDVAKAMVAGLGAPSLVSVPPGAEVAEEAATGIGDTGGGSNNWVLGGARTKSGAPLLAGDPHRELEAPNVYVQGHVACPEWDAIGIGMAGVPGFPHFGHNQRVAWSITHGMADDQDLFEFEPGALPQGRTETITVRDADPVEVEVLTTDRGPIIGEGLALCWTATIDTNTGFDAIAPMLSARTVDELFDTMRPWVEPVNSLLAADVDGSIGYLTRGRLPRRSNLDAAWLPVPGDDPRFAWDGWVAFEDLPRCVNPGTAFLFSANNRISADPDAPYIGLDVAARWRSQRIVETLSAHTDATLDDMTALHRDTLSIPARRLAGRLAWAPLQGWDGEMSAHSPAAAAYSVLRREMLRLALERSGLGGKVGHPRNRLFPGVVSEGALWRVVEQHFLAGDTSLLGGWTWDELLATAKARAEESWTGQSWGELHASGQRHALFVDEFNPPPVAYGGDLDTVMAASYTPTAATFKMIAGAVARYAFDLADWDASGWVIPLGAAGEPGTAHSVDQQPAWAEGTLLPAPYSRAAIDKVSTDLIVLDPA